MHLSATGQNLGIAHRRVILCFVVLSSCDRRVQTAGFTYIQSQEKSQIESKCQSLEGLFCWHHSPCIWLHLVGPLWMESCMPCIRGQIVDPPQLGLDCCSSDILHMLRPPASWQAVLLHWQNSTKLSIMESHGASLPSRTPVLCQICRSALDSLINTSPLLASSWAVLAWLATLLKRAKVHRFAVSQAMHFCLQCICVVSYQIVDRHALLFGYAP